MPSAIRAPGRVSRNTIVEVTFLAAAAPDKCWRVAFTLPGIAEIIGSDMAIDGNRLTAITLSDAGDFTGFVITHRGDLIGYRRRNRNTATLERARHRLCASDRGRLAGADPDVRAA